MRLIEFYNASHHPHGTIAMLKPCGTDAEKLYKWCINNNISCIDKDKLHCTVLYSKAPVEHLTKFNNKNFIVKSKINQWEKLGDALTLKLSAPTAEKIHSYMRSQGGTHDFPEYIAHISVCYKWTDNKLPDILPDFPIIFDKLQVTPIDPNFSG